MDLFFGKLGGCCFVWGGWEGTLMFVFSFPYWFHCSKIIYSMCVYLYSVYTYTHMFYIILWLYRVVCVWVDWYKFKTLIGTF